MATDKQLAFIEDLRARIASRRARRRDPQTSHEVAARLGNVTAAQQRIVDLIEEIGPVTDSELEAHAKARNWPKAGKTYYRRRRSELKQFGLLAPSGQRRKNLAGNTETVWELASSNEMAWAVSCQLDSLSKADASRVITVLLGHLDSQGQ